MATDTKVPLLIWCVWLLFVISVSFLALRLYTQMFIKKRIFLDDYIVLLASGLFLGFSITITLGAKAGLGDHLDVLDLEAIATVRKYALVAQTLSIVGAGISKLSLGLLLLRIVFQRWHKVALIIPMVIMLVISAVAVVLLWTQITPVAALYDPRVEGATHFQQLPILLSHSIILLVSDFYFATFPSFFIWELQVKLKEKITVATGLGIGVLAGACGIARTYELPQFNPSDFTYDQVNQIILTAAEWAVTLICNSIPVLFPLWRRMVHGSNYSSNGYSGGVDGYPRETGARAFSRAYPKGNASIRLDNVPGRQAVLQKQDVKMGLTNNQSNESILGSLRRQRDRQSGDPEGEAQVINE